MTYHEKYKKSRVYSCPNCGTDTFHRIQADIFDEVIASCIFCGTYHEVVRSEFDSFENRYSYDWEDI